MKKNLTVEETFDLAVKSYQEKKFHSAEKLYKEVLKKHPDHANTYVNLGMVLKKLDKHNTSESTSTFGRSSFVTGPMSRDPKSCQRKSTLKKYKTI